MNTGLLAKKRLRQDQYVFPFEFARVHFRISLRVAQL